MNKKLIIIILIISILVLFLTIIFFTYNLYKSKSKLVQENKNKIFLKQTQEDTTLMNNAIQSLNADECAKITTQSEFISRDSCYNYLAQETNQKSLCDKINQEKLKENCYENIR